MKFLGFVITVEDELEYNDRINKVKNLEAQVSSLKNTNVAFSQQLQVRNEMIVELKQIVERNDAAKSIVAKKKTTAKSKAKK